jgi:hypothetical protein
VIAGRQRSIVQLCAEVAPVNVSDHFAIVAACGQEFARELVHRTGLGTGNLDGGVQRRSDRQLGQIGDDVVRGNRLEERGRQADHIALCARFDDAADELEELRRAQDRIRNAGRLDQVLLRHLGAEVATVGITVAADDRQRQVMIHARGFFRGHQVAARRLEEGKHRLVLPRGCVRQIDDDLRAGQRLFQSLARDGVDARVGRGRHDVVAGRAQHLDQLRADEAGAANDDDLHVQVLLPMSCSTTGRMPARWAESLAATFKCD